jgi:hypothetical protein
MFIDNKEYITSLVLDENQKIVCFTDDNITIISGYSYATVYFDNASHLYKISEEYPLHLFLEDLQILLKQALFGNLIIDDSLQQNLGYVWNQWINDHAIQLTQYTDKNNDTYWIGLRHQLAAYECAAWIYNDENYNIIFEITPGYPLGCIDQENQEEVAKYKKWLESYQPILKTIISPEIAHQWIAQAQEIIEIIEKNTDIVRAQE